MSLLWQGKSPPIPDKKTQEVDETDEKYISNLKTLIETIIAENQSFDSSDK